MSNYIKTLLLSTIVLIMGNNSYSMEDNTVQKQVDNIDQKGIRRTVNGLAIPDLDEKGNIIENEHFLQDGDYLAGFYIKQLENELEKKHCTEEMSDFLKHEVLKIYIQFKHYLSSVAFCIYPINTQTSIDTSIFESNNALQNIVSEDIIWLSSTITPVQLTNYLKNKAYVLLIHDIKEIKNIIDNNKENCKDHIIAKMSCSIYNIQQMVNSLEKFCSEKNLEISRYHSSFMDTLIKRSKKVHYYLDFYKKLDDVLNIMMTDKNFTENIDLRNDCNDLILKLCNILNNRYSKLQNIEFLDKFKEIYNSIVENISYNSFANYQEDIEKLQNNKSKVETFLRKEANSISINIIHMITDIRNKIKRGNLDSQQLYESIKQSLSMCIDAITNIEQNIISILKGESPLTEVFEYNHKMHGKMLSNIIDGMEKLRQLKQAYGLHIKKI